jgi:hypothetical protein
MLSGFLEAGYRCAQNSRALSGLASRDCNIDYHGKRGVGYAMTTTSALPETMKAAVVETAGPPSALHIKDVPVPKLARNH